MTADPTEVMALRVIIMAVVAALGNLDERLGGGSGRGFVNRIGGICQETLLGAELGNEVRTQAIDHVNRILGGIGFPPDEDKPN